MFRLPVFRMLMLSILTLTFFPSFAVDTGFLDQNQSDSGAIYRDSDIALPQQSTSESLITLDSVANDSRIDTAAAISWLQANDMDESSYNLAQEILSGKLSASTLNNQLTSLYERCNSDGGFGAFPHYDSDVLSTAFALQAFAAAGLSSSEEASYAVAYLMAQQQNDGSWGIQANPLRVETTAITASALWQVRNTYQVSDNTDRAIHYLWSEHQAGHWNSTEASALALITILNNAVDRSAYMPAVNTFTAQQRSNKSFENDVYLTALGLRVIGLASSPAADDILLSGRVLDAETGNPLSTALVTLTGASDREQAVNSDGRFSLRGLTAGSYKISLAAGGYTALTMNTLLQVGARTDLGDLSLNIQTTDPDTGEAVTTGTVRGVVSDARTGMPIAGAVVSELTQGQTTVTAADGSYQLSALQAGTIQLTVSANGYSSAGGNATLAASSVLIFSPNLQQSQATGVSLSGIVYSSDGAALPGAQITATTSSGTVTAVSDAEGNYEIKALTSGHLAIEVSLAGYQTLSVSSVTQDGSDLRYSPVMKVDDGGEQVGTVLGTVTAADTGAAIVGAQVRVDPAGFTAITDDNGHYEFTGVTAGSVTVNISADNYASAIASGNLNNDGILNFSPALSAAVSGFTLQGTATAADSGTLLAGVEITVTDGNGNKFSATTDSGGHYLIQSAEPGDSRFIASLNGYLSVIAEAQTTDNSVVEFSPVMFVANENNSASMQGVITDAITGRGLAGVTLQLTTASGNSVTLTSGEDGEFMFTGLTGGNAQLSVSMDRYYPLTAEFTLTAGIRGDIGEIQLTPESDNPAATLTGSVVDVRTGDPLSGVVIAASGVARFEAITAADGSFSLPVPADDYSIVLTLSGYNPQTLWASPAPGALTDLGKIRMRAPGVDSLLSDLSVQSLDIDNIQFSQTDFSVSGNISGRLENIGNIAVAVPFDIAVFQDTDLDGQYSESTDILLGTTTIISDDELAVDGQAEFSVAISGKQTFYSAPLTVMLDSGNVLAELSESNNIDVAAGHCSTTDGPLLDLAFCMDSSGSVSSSEFRLQLEGTAQAIEDRNITPRNGSVRVSALQFSSSAYTELEPTIIEEDNVTDIADAIRSISKRGGGTSIHACINQARDLVINAMPVSAIQTIDVSTDGQSTQSYAVTASQAAVAAGVDVINGIGVGTGVNNTLMNAIVYPQPAGGNSGFVIGVSGYEDYMEGIASKIERETSVVDLTVGGLKLSDNGSSLNAELELGNGGAGNIVDGISVNLYSGDPDNGGTLITTYNYEGGLSSGAHAHIEISDIDTSLFIATTITVVVDINNNIPECTRRNNSQTINIGTLKGDISVELDAGVYAPQSDVQITSATTNSGLLNGNYIVSLQVADTNGNIVENLNDINISDLAAGGVQNNTLLWNTTDTLAGNYQVIATLKNPHGDILATGSAGFRISELENDDGTNTGVTAATVRAYTDSETYFVTDSVTLSSVVRNTTTIHILSGATLQLMVTDPYGNEIYNSSKALSDLTPGAALDLDSILTLTNAAEGIYIYQAVLHSTDGSILANASSNFTVINDPVTALKGQVDVAIRTLTAGDIQTCSYHVTNSGTADLTAVALTTRVISVDSENEMRSSDLTIDLAAQEHSSFDQTFSTTGWEGNYICVLQAVTDADDGSLVTLASAAFMVEKPEVTLSLQLQGTDAGRVLVLVDGFNGAEPGNNSAADLQQQYEALNNLLSNLNIDYLIVDNLCDFNLAFNSGRFNQYLLLSETVQPDNLTLRRLWQAAERGDGVLLTSALLKNNQLAQTIAAGKLSSAQPEATSVHWNVAGYSQTDLALPDATDVKALIPAGDASIEASYPLISGEWQYEQNDQCMVSDSAPAAVMNSLAHGHVLSAGTDIAWFAGEDENWATALGEMLIRIAPAGRDYHPDNLIPLTLVLNRSGGDLPAETVTLVMTVSGSAQPSNPQWQQLADQQWQLNVELEAGNAITRIDAAYSSNETGEVSVQIEMYDSGNNLLDNQSVVTRVSFAATLAQLRNQLNIVQQANTDDPWLLLAQAELQKAFAGQNIHAVLVRLMDLLSYSTSDTTAVRTLLADVYLQQVLGNTWCKPDHNFNWPVKLNPPWRHHSCRELWVIKKNLPDKKHIVAGKNKHGFPISLWHQTNDWIRELTGMFLGNQEKGGHQ